jgi:hypothetical protein
MKTGWDYWLIIIISQSWSPDAHFADTCDYFSLWQTSIQSKSYFFIGSPELSPYVPEAFKYDFERLFEYLSSGVSDDLWKNILLIFLWGD